MLPTLLPYLVDEEKAADYFCHQRWPNGVNCPYCSNEDITERERSANGFQRYLRDDNASSHRLIVSGGVNASFT